MHHLIQFLIARPLLVNLLLIFILLMSFLSAQRLQRLGLPRVDINWVRISTVYPGASAEDVELNVSIPLEEALRGVDGLEKVNSDSVENFSKINVKIDPDAENPAKIKAHIQSAINNVSNLPAEISDGPTMMEVKTDNEPVYRLALRVPDNDKRKLRRHAKNLKKQLQQLPAVARVLEEGVPEREIQVLLDRKKLAANYISFEEVLRAIQLNRLRANGGSIDSFVGEKNIVTFAELTGPDDLEKVIIRSNFMGHRIRVGDVGRVVDGFRARSVRLRFNGGEGVALAIVRKGTSDLITATAEIREAAAEYERKFESEGLEIISVFDDSVETKNRLNILYGNALMGLGLVFSILYFFLDRKTAWWTALGIPLSIGITVTAMALLDVTINRISLCGLIVVVGMVVDDAIIIAESIARFRERGLSATDAAVAGVRVVLRPVLGTIATTVLAFLPIYFLPSELGSFAAEIPTIVILMLGASFIEATTLLPVHLAHARTIRKQKLSPGMRVIALLERFYTALLRLSLRFRYLTMVFFVLFLGIGIFISIQITRFNLFPADQAYRMAVFGETERNRGLDFTAVEIKKLEEVIRLLPEGTVLSYQTIIGRGSGGNMGHSGSFGIALTLSPSNERELMATDIRDFIQEKFESLEIAVPKLNFYIDSGGPPSGKPLEVVVSGNDSLRQREIVERVMADLKEFAVTDVESNLKSGKSEIRLIPNQNAIADAGLTVAAIASAVHTAFDGSIATYYQTPAERIPCRVMLDPKGQKRDNPLGGLLIRNSFGNLVVLQSLVHETPSSSVQIVYRFQSERAVTITANIDREQVSTTELYKKLKEKYKGFEKLYPGFRLILGGEAQKSSETLNSLLVAIILALTGIYFLLSIQFGSLTQPLMVISAIPFGLVGILLAFGFQGMDLSMLAMVGILGFSGVVVNNSLILVDFINRMQKYGDVGETGNSVGNGGDGVGVSLSTAEFNQRVVRGAVLRLRPVFLSTFTTMAGLIPTAYGIIGGVDSFISPMVMAISWGLLTGTSSVLIVIPVLYSIGNDFSGVFRRVFRRGVSAS